MMLMKKMGAPPLRGGGPPYELGQGLGAACRYA